MEVTPELLKRWQAGSSPLSSEELDALLDYFNLVAETVKPLGDLAFLLRSYALKNAEEVRKFIAYRNSKLLGNMA